MIYTMGETLMDLIFSNTGQITATPGGAMFNTSVSLTRKQVSVRLISELGNDEIGKKINGFMRQNGIDDTYITYYKNEKTSLALAFLDKNAKPSYSFYKTYPNNRFLITTPPFFAGDYLLFGSLYSLDKAIREDIVTIVNKAKRAKTTVIYDPNIRHAHHLKDIQLKKAIFKNIELSDIIKGSDEDFTNIFGEGYSDYWSNKILEINPKAVVIVTIGEKGSIAYTGDGKLETPSSPIKVVSTVGAGDAFNAGMLFQLNNINKATNELSRTDWRKVLLTATQFATEVCGSNENYIGKTD